MGAWTNFANPTLLDQPALSVVVGNSGGDASTTGLGALRPGSGLENALLFTKHVRFRLGSKCCKLRKATELDWMRSNTLETVKTNYKIGAQC